MTLRLLATSLVLAAVAAASAGAATERFVAHTLDGRGYKLYVPAGYQPGRAAPLVVMLHGCTQDPDSFAAATRMNELAEREGFLALYPRQTPQDHPYNCWHWFEPKDQARGAGEPGAIAAMVKDVESQYQVDPAAVYLAGLSAGGAMATIVGADYPDLFAAVGVVAGLEYGAATTEPAARVAMRAGGPWPRWQGEHAYDASGKAVRPLPAIVFHGTGDQVVAPLNGHQVAEQWSRTNGLAVGAPLFMGPAQQVANPAGRAVTLTSFRARDGAEWVQLWEVAGMPHAWPGGLPGGSYTDPTGPDASQLIWRFFQAHRRK